MATRAFFDLGAPPKASKAPARKGGCLSCGRDQSCKSPDATRFRGKGLSGILILAEAPEGAEDVLEPFSSPESAPLWEMEGQRFAPNILRECTIGYVVGCPADDHPSYSQAMACSDAVQAKIAEMKPRVIITLGPVAFQSLIWDRIGGRLGNTKPGDYIGHCIPDREINAWICPTFSFSQIAAYLESKTGDGDAVPLMMFQQHLRMAWNSRLRQFPDLPKPENMHIVQDPLVAAGWINAAIQAAEEVDHEVAFDYETTGIKPHAAGHRIASSALAWRGADGVDHVVAFPWDGDHPDLVNNWERLMRHEGIGKIAHKLDFESCWTHFRAGLGDGRVDWWIDNWAWDTCIAAHCINNMGKVSLKFLVYVYYGVLGYDSEADHYITTLLPGENPDSKNARNLLAKRPKGLPPGAGRHILQYNALDAIYTLLIRRIQNDLMTPFQLKGFRFFVDASSELAIIQSEGLPIDMAELERQWAYCSGKISEWDATARATHEARKWTSGPFQPSSNDQLATLLYDILKYPPVNPKEPRKVDENALSKIGSPICKAVLELRKWTKIRDTFLDGIRREAVKDPDGNWYVRTFFNLATGADDGAGGPKTFRSSSDSPNLQNVPKRDKEIMGVVRSCFRALPDEYIEEYDYKGVEVAGGACVHKDPKMIEYIKDPRNNMHTDTAADMYFRKVSDVPKDERNGAKGGFVFPSFYGATVNSIAPKTWEDMSDKTRAHIAENGRVTYWNRDEQREVSVFGIHDYETWRRHIQNVFKHFWGVRFRVYDAWKRDVCWKFYQEHGYVELYTGFYCYGPAGFTQVTNSPIQGPSFHIQLWTLINCNREFRRLGLRTRMACQIHDAMVPRTKVGEEVEVQRIIKEYGTVKVREHWPWIIVPLTIEAERSDLGGTWAKMTHTGVLE